MNLTLRLALDLYEKLKVIALNEERSINGEINYIIRKYIEELEKKKINNLLLLIFTLYIM